MKPVYAKELAEQYEQRVQEARQKFNDSLAIQALTSSAGSDPHLIMFLINFCSNGIGMTKPVQSWVSRVGDRCIELGLQEEGQQFKMHAIEKSYRHVALQADLKMLVAYWNAGGYQPHLSVEKLLARPLSPGVIAYQKMHEDIIASSNPFSQFVVEYEVDRLSIEYGAWMMRRCMERFGKVFLSRISYFQSNVSIQIGKLQFNWLGLGRVLAAHPDYMDAFVDIGKRTLAVYQCFLADCVVKDVSAA